MASFPHETCNRGVLGPRVPSCLGSELYVPPIVVETGFSCVLVKLHPEPFSIEVLYVELLLSFGICVRV